MLQDAESGTSLLSFVVFNLTTELVQNLFHGDLRIAISSPVLRRGPRRSEEHVRK
jgi:hypothetical protein